MANIRNPEDPVPSFRTSHILARSRNWRIVPISRSQTKRSGGAMWKIAVILCVLLAGCGGDSAPPNGDAKIVKTMGPQLRPCETTGPTAPPCPSN